MGNSNSPPTFKNRKRSYSNMADNTATKDDSSSSEESITDIQTDLQAVENRLSSPDRAKSHGRAVFDSIGSALGRLRSRMQAISPSNNSGLNLPATASGRKIAVGAKDQGQSSTLVASRKYAESHEEIEVVLHEGLGIVKPIVEDPNRHEEMVQSDQGEFDVLLSATTMKKLDSSRNLDILLQSQSSSFSQSSTTVYTWGGHISMYLLHESLDGNGHEKQVNRKEPQPIPSNSRIGRSNVVSVAVYA
jgi:hypothetical protein